MAQQNLSLQVPARRGRGRITRGRNHKPRRSESTRRESANRVVEILLGVSECRAHSPTGALSFLNGLRYGRAWPGRKVLAGCGRRCVERARLLLYALGRLGFLAFFPPIARVLSRSPDAPTWDFPSRSC